jgi:serine/threonine-protein kinase
MAEVFLARDRVLNRIVAVKVMRAEQPDETQLRRFLREAQITAQLAHPNVVPVHAMENDGGGRPAFVMKCVQGDTLREFLRECRAARGTPQHDPDRHGVAARIDHLLKVCDAIAFAHDRGVAHLDLKPSNVMLGRFGAIYVMDWGIARLTGERPGEEEHASHVPRDRTGAVSDTSGLLTGAGGVLGTPAYMAPEQVEARGLHAGPAADQFALGMMLQESLTLHPPRPPRDAKSMLDAAAKGERSPFGSDPDEPPVPRALQAVVVRATAARPEDRYPSVAALAADLRRWQRNEELHAFPDNPLLRLWRTIQRHPVRAMAIVMIVLLTAAGTSIASLRHALATSERNQRESALLASIVSRLSGFVHGIEGRAASVEVLVESLAAQVEGALANPASDEATFPSPADLDGPDAPADTAESPRYRQRVSFAVPVVVRSPDHDEAASAAALRHLGALPATFQRVFERAAQQGGVTPPADLPAFLRSHPQFGYAYVGLEAGVLVSYPGNAIFPPDYDPRQRPWYRTARASERPMWGAPYPDASGSGFLVPCNRRIVGADGAFAGVIGIDVFLDRLLEVLYVPDLDHQRRTLLVDEAARIVASGDEAGSSWGVGTFDDRSKDRRPLDVPGLAARIRDGAQNGFHREPEALYVFSRFNSVGWYVVVELDPRRTFAD